MCADNPVAHVAVMPRSINVTTCFISVYEAHYRRGTSAVEVNTDLKVLCSARRDSCRRENAVAFPAHPRACWSAVWISFDEQDDE